MQKLNYHFKWSCMVIWLILVLQYSAYGKESQSSDFINNYNQPATGLSYAQMISTGNIPSLSTIPAQHFSSIVSNNLLYSVQDMRQVISLDYVRNNRSDVGSSWQLKIDYKLIDKSQSPYVEEYRELTISDKNYKDVAVHSFLSSDWAIEITNIQQQFPTTLSAAIKNDIRLNAKTEISYYKNIGVYNISGFNLQAIGNDAELEFTWNSDQETDEYELEYLFIDELDRSSTSIFNSASNNPGNLTGNWLAFDHAYLDALVTPGLHYKEPVNVVLPTNRYRIHSTYPEGVLYCRVRAVSRLFDNTEAINFGPWSYYYYELNNSFESTKVWTSAITYAEEGKHKEIVTYYDGASNPRQTITHLSDGSNSPDHNLTVIAESKYDYEGKAVLQVLPAVINSHAMSYQNSFNGSYTKNMYDKLNHAPSDPLPLTSGAGLYYSPGVLNQFTGSMYANMMKYLPDAGGYAYNRTEYKGDGTGRISATGGAGATHQIGNGHDTRYYYTQANATELHRLFGSNVGAASHYKKNYTVDPNGQVNVTYLDQESRTIATALSGEAPPNLESINNTAPITMVADLMMNNTLDIDDKQSKLAYVFYNSVPNTTYHFKYDLTGSKTSLFPTICRTCSYKVTIDVTDDLGNRQTISNLQTPVVNSSTDPGLFTANMPPAAATCTLGADQVVEFDVVLPATGEYKVSKLLTLADGEISNYWAWVVENYGDMPDLNDLEAAYQTSIDSAVCDLTCTGAFKSACEQKLENEVTNWTSLTQQQREELLAECIDSLCNEMIDEAFNESSAMECSSILHQMINSIMPDIDGQLDYEWYNASWFSGLTYPLVLQNPQDATDQVTLSGVNDFKNAEIMKFWVAELLVVHHREYCHYLACTTRIEVDVFEAKLMACQTKAEAIALGFWNIVTAAAAGDLEADPVFNTGGYAFGQKGNMFSAMSNFKCGSTTIQQYFQYSGAWCNSQQQPQQSNADMFYAGLILPADAEEIDNRHWQLMKSSYLELRNQMIDAVEQTTCPFQTDEHVIVKPKTTNLPTDANSQAAFEQEFNQTYGQSNCDAIVGAWRDVMINECDVNGNYFDQYIAPYLSHYCNTHTGPANPMGFMFDEHLTTDPDLLAVAAALDNHLPDDYCTPTLNANCCLYKISRPNPYAYTFSETYAYPGSTFEAHEITGYTEEIEHCVTQQYPCIFELINFLKSQTTFYDADNHFATFSSTQLPASVVACFGDGTEVYVSDSANIHHIWIKLNNDKVLSFLLLKPKCNRFTANDPCNYTWEMAADIDLITNNIYTPVPYSLPQTVTGQTLYFPTDAAICDHHYTGIGVQYQEPDNTKIFTGYLFSACIDISNSNNVICSEDCIDEYGVEICENMAVGYTQEVGIQVDMTNYYENCIAQLIEMANQYAYEDYEEQYKNLSEELFLNLETCFTSPFDEDFTMTYPFKEYHYTLYYYDQSGNLVQTVPPEGVYPLGSSDFVNGEWIDDGNHEPQHKLITRYKQNSLNLAIQETTPDAGTTYKYYDSKGQLKISQSARQVTGHKYSFTYYDEQGRITSTGQVEATQNVNVTRQMLDPETFMNNFQPMTYPQFMDKITDLQLTTYDFSPVSDNANVRGRVAVSVRAESLSQVLNGIYNGQVPGFSYMAYLYDIHGNVKILGSHIAMGDGMPRMLHYKYDLISGKVNYVRFADDNDHTEFLHRYTYDADNRLKTVETSRTGIVWQTEATYRYWPHGPLARVVLGQDAVQGLDYYTLQGWLRGINAISGTDPGQDASDVTGGNPHTAKDEFALSLGYYQGDYTPVSASLQVPFATANDWNTLKADMVNTGNNPGLFNGNISFMAVNIAPNYKTMVPGYNQPEHPFINGGGSINATVYKYDQLNRIKQGVAFDNGTGLAKTNTSAFLEQFSYDANGNILSLYRRSRAADMDNLTYKYYTDVNGRTIRNNQLQHVNETVAPTVMDNDIDHQGTMYINAQNGDIDGNYHYDRSGNLIKDKTEQIDQITWDIYGKIKTITRTAGSTKPDLEFFYDAMGQRVTKIEKVKDAGGNLEPETLWQYTNYYRDATGNVMCINQSTGLQNFSSSYPIYGSSRIGVYNHRQPQPHLLAGTTDALGDDHRLMGLRSYELTNHLGNVMVTVSDKKKGIDNGRYLLLNGQWLYSPFPDGKAEYYQADVTSANDYYSFGMLMPGRSYNSAEYRYGFNGKEKDDEVKGSGAQYDYGFRIYEPRLGKFLSVDPLQKKFPFYSPYHFAGNSPIANVDLDGREPNWFMIPIYWELAKAKIKKWINDSGDELSGGINEYARGANGGYSDEHLPDQVNTMRNTYHQVHGAAVVADNLITKPGEFAAESAGSIPGVDVVSDPLLATYFGAKGDYASASAYTAAAAFPFVSGFVLKNAGKGLQYALKATDLDLRGSTVVFRDALEAAFEKTGVKKSEFEITKWAKNKEGKSVPVEYRAKGGAEVSIDAAHDWSNGPSGPDAPHIGWQTGGKGKNQQSGHIILDDVPANRSTKKE
ncbi:MAG: hypothetical protein IPN22_10940 [Bacteroidetes bacterium]|nr:hypothetical protein [Bacteroidota bacterium]